MTGMGAALLAMRLHPPQETKTPPNRIDSVWSSLIDLNPCVTTSQSTSRQFTIPLAIEGTLLKILLLFPLDSSCFTNREPLLTELPEIDQPLSYLSSKIWLSQKFQTDLVNHSLVIEKIAKHFIKKNSSHKNTPEIQFLSDRFLTVFYFMRPEGLDASTDFLFEEKMYYYFIRGSRVIKTHSIFKDFVKTVCYNGKRPPSKPTSPKSSKEMILQRYGEKKLSEWVTSYKLRTDQIKNAEIGWNSFCSGISIDFISKYWKKIQSGKTPEEAAIMVGACFTEAATPQAEMNQILAESYLTMNSKAPHEALFSLVGLQTSQEKIALTTPPTKWPEGSFLIRIDHSVFGGHTLAMILTCEQCLIFDPYYGTLIAKREQVDFILNEIFERWGRNHEEKITLISIKKLEPSFQDKDL